MRRTGQVTGMSESMRWLLPVIAGVVLAGCAGNPKLEHHSRITFEREATAHVDQTMDYLLYLPPGYDAPKYADRRWPLLIVLNGIMENGETHDRLLRYGPASLIEKEDRQYPFIIITPLNENPIDLMDVNRSAWPVDLVAALTRDAIDRYRVDADRVYLTGMSLGGLATWSTASAHPDLFAAVAPMAGFGYPAEVDRMSHIPVWAFHGEADPVVPLEAGRKMVEAHREAGGNAQWTTYPGVGHLVWTRVYSEPDLYEWFLEHSR